MLENLLVTLNALLVQHPDLLGFMRYLFWLKSWLLLCVFSIFVYLVYMDGRLSEVKKLIKQSIQGNFKA
jgi:hypothetical protein